MALYRNLVPSFEIGFSLIRLRDRVHGVMFGFGIRESEFDFHLWHCLAIEPR